MKNFGVIFALNCFLFSVGIMSLISTVILMSKPTASVDLRPTLAPTVASEYAEAYSTMLGICIANPEKIATYNIAMPAEIVYNWCVNAINSISPQDLNACAVTAPVAYMGFEPFYLWCIDEYRTN